MKCRALAALLLATVANCTPIDAIDRPPRQYRTEQYRALGSVNNRLSVAGVMVAMCSTIDEPARGFEVSLFLASRDEAWAQAVTNHNGEFSVASIQEGTYHTDYAAYLLADGRRYLLRGDGDESHVLRIRIPCYRELIQPLAQTKGVLRGDVTGDNQTPRYDLDFGGLELAEAAQLYAAVDTITIDLDFVKRKLDRVRAFGRTHGGNESTTLASAADAIAKGDATLANQKLNATVHDIRQSM